MKAKGLLVALAFIASVGILSAQTTQTAPAKAECKKTCCVDANKNGKCDNKENGTCTTGKCKDKCDATKCQGKCDGTGKGMKKGNCKEACKGQAKGACENKAVKK